MIDVSRLLNSIGKECFVKYFDEFKENKLSNMELAEIISEKEDYSIQASKTRVNSARKIIKFNKESNALDLIIASKRLEIHIIEKAKEISNSLIKDKDGL